MPKEKEKEREEITLSAQGLALVVGCVLMAAAVLYCMPKILLVLIILGLGGHVAKELHTKKWVGEKKGVVK